MPRLMLAGLLALIAALAVALPAEAKPKPKPKKPTTVEAVVNFPFVEGKVKAVEKCRAKRTVQLFEVSGDEKTKAETAKTDSKGEFRFSEFVTPFTQYRVVAPRKATRRLVCKQGESGTISGAPFR